MQPMEFDRENPSPLARLPGGADAHWHDWSPELETAYLQQIAGVERLEDATSLQLVVNTEAGGSIAHLGGILPNLHELNLNGSNLESLRDLGTGFRLLQVLWVSRCGLKALDGLNGLPVLRELYAAYNDITDLQPVDSCQQLEILDMECNCIAETDAVLYLTSCTNLQTLTLAGNPAAEQPGYRRSVCVELPWLNSLDDEPVTPADQGRGGAAGGGGAAAPGSRHSAAPEPLPPPPLKAFATALASSSARSSLDAGSMLGLAAAGTRASAAPPDADELAFVVEGIKHARVGVDSHEFREIEMNLLVATADGTDVQLDVRPGTSTLLPASASTWVRTLRSSREGSLAALRATHVAAAASAARTGSQSPTSPCSASPISSRPTSSQRNSTLLATAPQPERWAVPTAAGISYGMSSSFGPQGTGGGAAAGQRRPSSGAGVGTSGGGMGGAVDSPLRPGSGGYRPGTGRPYSARPGTAASFSMRMGTSASTGTAPASSNSAGLYWAKNRINGGSGGRSGGGGGDGPGVSAAINGVTDTDGLAGSSKLTQGSETTFGGSFARDLRKWKGAAVRAAASTSTSASGGGDANGRTAAVLGGGNGLSLTLLRGGQLDPKALLEELKRWKLETADKVLFVDPDEAASSDGWAGAEASDMSGGRGLLGNGQADILRISSSQDGAAPDMGSFALGLGLALLEQGPEAGYSPATPGSPLQPARQPAGAAAAGRRKMVLAKVLRDIAADSIGGSGTSITEILAGLRPVHAPSAYAGGHTPSVAWGAPAEYSERERSGGSSSSAHHHHHQHHHQQQQQHHQQQHAQGQQQQQGGQRPGSSMSVCSSSGQSDYGNYSVPAQPSRPGSREELAVGGSSSSGGGGSSNAQYGGALQRQKSASRAPGLPVGPSAPVGAFRFPSAAGEVDVRSSNPSPVARHSDW